MYTQCPECGVAFNVTAEVLKQAAGQVRCGGCGVAFNALDFLSEEKPAAPVQSEPEQQLAEPAPDEPVELEPVTAPKTISAAQSAALLKTLDELAGSDIRIEDTGIEWRVLNEDEEAAALDDASAEKALSDEASAEALLEGSFKPKDEVVTEDASNAEAPEAVEEMRFDDNTPLPEDFNFESAASAPASPPVVDEREPTPEPAATQVDLAFGDPDEWEDLLGDLIEPAVPEAPQSAEPDLEDRGEPGPEQPEPDELKQIDAADELRAVAEEPVCTEDVAPDQPLDMDTQFAIQAEAMGIDLSGLHATAGEEPAEDELKETLQDHSSGETSIEEDLISAAFEAEAAQREDTMEVQVLEPSEIAELEALELEALAAESPAGPGAVDEELELAEPHNLDEELELAEPETLDKELEPAVKAAEKDEIPADEEQGEPIEIELDEDMVLEEAERRSDVEEIARPFDDKVEEVIETMSASLEDEAAESEVEDASDEHVVPEMSEEEKTINMMIDAELFNIAVEDEDGFASTIVQIKPNIKVEEEVDDNKEKVAQKKKKTFKRPPIVETIIMEGNTVRGELGDEDKLPQFDSPRVSLPPQTETDNYMRRRATDRPSGGMIGGAAVLLILLVLQAVHQSREALATMPAFNRAVGPVYRMLGKPLTPMWDISGWRFEATKGSTDESDELLTIYSRVGNESEQGLPYPLVHVSLTDRFEEIIGSRVLEPAQYLAADADPRKLVPPGNTFNAIISIASPAAEAIGFKLNVCYRLASGQLRCALEDFK